MEGMFNFVGIIIIVFGVLQIILFFKIWSNAEILSVATMIRLSPLS